MSARTRSRSLTAAFQSLPSGATGALMVTETRARLHVEALDELRAYPAQKETRDEVVLQLALGDERILAPGQDREQHRAVEVARVVRGHDVGAVARQILETAYRERYGAEPKKK